MFSCRALKLTSARDWRHRAGHCWRVHSGVPGLQTTDALGGKLVLAIDVAKVDMVAAIAAADGRVLQTPCWKAPVENPRVLAILRHFRLAGISGEAGMEPSGTYGDVLRHQVGVRDRVDLKIVDGHSAIDTLLQGDDLLRRVFGLRHLWGVPVSICNYL
jgi:hypothetical protein